MPSCVQQLGTFYTARELFCHTGGLAVLSSCLSHVGCVSGGRPNCSAPHKLHVLSQNAPLSLESWVAEGERQEGRVANRMPG